MKRLDQQITLSAFGICRKLCGNSEGKLRFLENHDQLWAGFIIPNERELMNWPAFLYFQKRMAMLYGGRERNCIHLPSLFDKDPVDWASGPDCSDQLRRQRRGEVWQGKLSEHPHRFRGGAGMSPTDKMPLGNYRRDSPHTWAEALALFPEIQKFFESEKGQKEF